MIDAMHPRFNARRQFAAGAVLSAIEAFGLGSDLFGALRIEWQSVRSVWGQALYAPAGSYLKSAKRWGWTWEALRRAKGLGAPLPPVAATIWLDTSFLTCDGVDALRQTAVHEAAHLIDEHMHGTGRGITTLRPHGHSWRRIMRELGQRAEVCSDHRLTFSESDLFS